MLTVLDIMSRIRIRILKLSEKPNPKQNRFGFVTLQPAKCNDYFRIITERRWGVIYLKTASSSPEKNRAPSFIMEAKPGALGTWSAIFLHFFLRSDLKYGLET
jgi:hypothetical protein